MSKHSEPLPDEEVPQQLFVSYDEAQKMLPFFRDLSETGRLARTRKAASSFVQELELVRNIEYVLGGRQILPTKAEGEVVAMYYKSGQEEKQ